MTMKIFDKDVFRNYYYMVIKRYKRHVIIFRKGFQKVCELSFLFLRKYGEIEG